MLFSIEHKLVVNNKKCVDYRLIIWKYEFNVKMAIFDNKIYKRFIKMMIKTKPACLKQKQYEYKKPNILNIKNLMT